MNRLLQYNDSPLEYSPYEAAAETSQESHQPQDYHPHRLWMPMQYERNYAYPLIVWLHNGESTERQLSKVMPHVSLRNYVAIAPRGTSSRYEADGTKSLACWDQTSEGIDSAQEAIKECIELARTRCHINLKKIFVAGYADGGTMALRMAFSAPRFFSGVVSFHGPLPQGNCPLRQFNHVRGGSVMLFSGRRSLSYPDGEVCRDIRLMHAAGLSVIARQYDTEDDVSSEMLAEMDRWMMSIVTQASPTSPKFIRNDVSPN